MLSDSILSLFRLVWYCFGILILIGICFNVLLGKRTDITDVVKPMLGILRASFKILSECCTAVADLIAKRIAPQHAGGIAAAIHLIMMSGIIIGVIGLASASAPRLLDNNAERNCCNTDRR